MGNQSCSFWLINNSYFLSCYQSTEKDVTQYSTQTIVLTWESILRSERVHINERTGMSFQISFHFIESSDLILHTRSKYNLKKFFPLFISTTTSHKHFIKLVHNIFWFRRKKQFWTLSYVLYFAWSVSYFFLL